MQNQTTVLFKTNSTLLVSLISVYMYICVCAT